MQYREKAGQSLTEPVTVAEFKTYSGYSAADQDTLMGDMITSVRKWFEDYTGLSIISKSYEVRYYFEDAVDEYFTLPFYPVSSITSVEVSGTAIEYDERGLDIISIRPYNTVIASSSTDEQYIDVEFIAVGDATQIKQGSLGVLRIMNDLWDNRKDNSPLAAGLSPAALTWDTMKFIDSLKINTGL